MDRWADVRHITPLETAIANARTAVDETRDVFFHALNNALNTFNDAVQTGNQPDREDLRTALEGAASWTGIAAESADQVPSGQFWIPRADHDRLLAVFMCATAVNNNQNSTVNQVNSVAAELRQANTEALDLRQVGTGT